MSNTKEITLEQAMEFIKNHYRGHIEDDFVINIRSAAHLLKTFTSRYGLSQPAAIVELTVEDLPEWGTCDENKENGVCTALENLIYNQEPANPKDAQEFRQQIVDLINSVRSTAQPKQQGEEDWRLHPENYEVWAYGDGWYSLDYYLDGYNKLTESAKNSYQKPEEMKMRKKSTAVHPQAAADQQRWISVETPPTRMKTEYVSEPLVLTDGKRITGGHCDIDSIAIYMPDSGMKPTHWMYASDLLPTAPGSQETDKK